MTIVSLSWFSYFQESVRGFLYQTVRQNKSLNYEHYTKHIIISVSDMPVIHFEYTQFYYPGDMDFPGENQSLDPSTQPKVFDL